MRERNAVVRPLRRDADQAPTQLDWSRVAYRMLVSRALDDLEQGQLLPSREVLYQFCARGHELSQALLAENLTGANDGVSPYYRGRPLMLSLGLSVEQALGSTMMRPGGLSEGRDIGVVFHMPRIRNVTVMPAAGGVGTQYTPGVGWAQALVYKANTLGEEDRKSVV